MKEFIISIFAVLLMGFNGSAASLPDGTLVTIPKGTYGWFSLHELQQSRDAFRSGNDELAAQLLKKNLRQGLIEPFKKNTKAIVSDDSGEYIALKTVGSDVKLWFARDNIKFSNTKTTAKSIKVITLSNRARLCPEPSCGQDKELARVQTNTELKTIGTPKKVGLANWYNVEYKGNNGWISEYDTNLAK